MDMNEMLADLPEEKRNAVIEAHKTAVEQERARSVTETRKKSEEIKRHMTEANRLKDALKNTLELESFDGDISEIIGEKLKTFKTASVNTADYVSRKDFERLQKQMGEITERERQANEKLRAAKVSDALNQAMADNFHAKDLLIKNLIASGDVTQTDSGEIVFLADGEELDIAKGIDRLKKNRPDLVKNTTIAGSGSSGHSNKKHENTMRFSDWVKLSPKQQNAFMLQKGKLTND